MALHVAGKLHLERASLAGTIEASEVTAILMSAALIGQATVLRTLLDQGADANARDPSGWTPLLETVFAGHVEAAKTLLERGADANAADDGGWTPLMEAAAKGNKELVSLLIRYGADADARNRQGWTPLKAAPKGDVEIRTLLRNASRVWRV